MDADELKYLRWLADSLVSSLGYEGAVSACRRMAWYGVLRFLLDEQGTRLHEAQPAEAKAA